MNVISMMEYGHKTVLDALKDVPLDRWNTPGVCGAWSVKDIIAHLTSYEHFFEDVVAAILDITHKTPTLDAMLSARDSFNDDQVDGFKMQSAEEVLNAYDSAWQKTMSTARSLPTELWEKDGLIPWYGDYTLSELMVYSIYGHKREHGAQIEIYHDTFKGQN